MYARLIPSADNDRSPRYMEKALAAIHQSLTPGEKLLLRYAAEEGQLTLGVGFPERLRDAVLGPLIANYPRTRIEIGDEARCSEHAWMLEVRLVPDIFPILRHSQFEDLLTHRYADPSDSLLQALRPSNEVQISLELAVSPAEPFRGERARRYLELSERRLFSQRPRWRQWFLRQATTSHASLAVKLTALLARTTAEPLRAAPLDTTSGYRHEREADLQAAADKLGGHLFQVQLRIVAEGEASRARERLAAAAGALGAFTRSRLATFVVSPIRQCTSDNKSRSFLLSHEELATLWHPPTIGVEAEGLHVQTFTELPAPANLPSGHEAGASIIGKTRYRHDERLIGIRQEDRRRHVHVIGRTGVGKTTLLLNQLQGDIVAGRGVGLVDPHGDLCDALLSLIPKHRTNDVILFDASDPDYAVAFNPLACPDKQKVDLVTSGAVSAIKKLYDSWGPRLENTLRNAIYVIVEQDGTLLSLLKLLTDEAYRQRVVPLVNDPVVRSFWQQEFTAWNKRYRTEAVAAITNKIQPFLTNRRVRAIVGQEGKSLDLRQAMDEGKIFIANLSKGKLGEDNSALLGAFLVTSIQQAAMTRADVPEEMRRDFYLYIDEFQNFVTTSFESILSEARKYRLNLTVSHQYLAQLNESTSAAIAGNVGTMIAFAVGNADAEWLASAMSTAPEQLTPRDFCNLPKYTAYVRLLVDGLPTQPFSVATLPPPEIVAERSEIVRKASRRQFCTRRT